MASPLAQVEIVQPDYAAERNRVWPRGGTLRENTVDLLLVSFFVGASGITFPFDLGPIQPLPRLVWAFADLFAVLFFLRHRDLLIALSRKNIPLLVWPLLACVSTAWSAAPGATLYYGIQLGMTMLVGFMISSYASLTRLLQCVFVAQTITSALSFAAVFLFPYVAYFDESAWQGLYLHKNMLGNAMAFQIILGTCLFLYGWRPIFTAAAVLLAMVLLLKSASASSVVIVIIALLPLPLLIGLRDRQSHGAAILGVGFIVAMLAGAFLFMGEMGVDPVETALGGLGKDRTLTGRTLLWDFAQEAYAERPWLGYGYRGYWESTETTATLLRVITDWPFGFFHNSLLEVSVAFGMLGPPALVGALFYAGYVGFRTYVREPTFINAWPLLYLPAIMTLSFSENPLFNNHGVAELLLVAIVTNGGIRGWVHR